MLSQYGLRSLNIHVQKLADIAKLLSDELPDFSNLGRNRTRLGAKKLQGDLVQFWRVLISLTSAGFGPLGGGGCKVASLVL